MKIKAYISDQTATAIQIVRQRFFPAWYVPNGTINATENKLENASDSCERWSIWCGFLVIISVAAEFAIDVAEPTYGLFLRLSAITGAGVAIGIVGEVLFNIKNSRIQTELRKRLSKQLESAIQSAAAANERAANAERDTEKLRAATAWRRLNQKQHESLALSLRASGPDASVKFCVLMNDQESLHFAQLISIPFKAAGWMIGYRFDSYAEGIMTGILLPEPRENWLEEMKIVNGRVRDAFMAAEIPFANGWPPQPYMQTNDDAPLRAPIAWVYIGPRPMPSLG
jgi:hypothetical protein